MWHAVFLCLSIFLFLSGPTSPVEGRSTQGRVYVYSGKDGSLLYHIDNPQPQAGAPYQDVGAVALQGQAFAFSGTDGSLLMTFHDPVPRPHAGFGWMVSAVTDVNTDEIPEILISAPFQTVDQFHVQGALTPERQDS